MAASAHNVVCWDTNVIWNTTTPDIPQCFQDTVLIWVPCGLLWLLAPLELHYIRKSKYQYCPWSGLNVARLICSAVLISTSAAVLITQILSNSNEISFPTSAILGSAIQCATYVLVLLLEILDKRSGLHSSAVLSAYFLIQMVASFGIYLSWMMRAVSDATIVQTSHFFPIVFALPFVIGKFILSCVADVIIESKPGKKNPCPVKYSSPLCNIFYSWFDSLAWIGYKRQITNDDLWSLDEDYTSADCFNEFEKLEFNYQKRKRSNQKMPYKHASVMRLAWSMNQTDFIIGVLIKYVGDILGFVNPLMLKQLINFVSSDEPAWHGYAYAGTIFVFSATAMICLNNHLYRMQVIGIRVRAALVSAIYRKSLSMSNTSKKNTTVGEIVTLMSVDAQRLMDVWQYVGFAFSMPLQVSLAIYLLWDMLGPSVIAGLIIILVIIPMNTIIANITSKIQIKVMKQKDQRTKLMNELLNGIKVLKLYAWEPPFANQVDGVRSSELKSLQRILYLQAVTTFILQCAPFLIAVCTFATYVLIDESNVLDATKAFVSMSLFDIIRIPLILVPTVIAVVVQTVVSAKRIDIFMRNEDIDPDAVTQDLIEDDPVVIRDGTFSWAKEGESVLTNIQLRIPEGNLVAVVGTVGAGKSSLISAILGEMEKIHGTVNLKGSVAYVAQQAWIQNATVRSNITFGLPFDEQFYNKVIDACALKTDLEILSGGDETEIGEKGINLSGGQKQRVSIARAVYSDAEIFLLDDPLSAVDAHVGKHIFDNVIGKKGLLKHKTRILVTHGISYLPYVDSIVVLNKGTISEIGSYKELLEKGNAFAEFMMTYLKEQEDLDEVESAELLEMQEGFLTQIGNEDVKRRLSERIIRALSSDDETSSLERKRKRSSRAMQRSPQQLKEPRDAVDIPPAASKLTKDEFMETGNVSMAVYKKYFQSFGSWQLFLTVSVLTLSWTCSFGSNYWLSLWSSDQPLSDGTQDVVLRDLRLGVYGGLGFGQAMFVLGAALSLVWGTIRASTLLHNNMMHSILRSPMEFFDTTPLGRILNRFSRDVDVTDVMIPTFLRPVLDCILQIIGTITIISLGSPIFLIIFLPLSVIYYFIQRLFIDASRQLKRMESVSRSPIYVHFSETISGLATLRAYRVQDRFIQILEDKMDISNALFFPILGAKRWLGVRLEAVGDSVVLCAALFAVIGRETMDPGVVGLSVNYAMSVTFVLMWLVRNWTDLESNIVSVERMVEYSNLKMEAPLENDSFRPMQSWPDKGEVKFQEYSTRYREGLDLVLRGISCDIKTNEKVGIVGRTGAGKSSLTLALFRLVEAAGGAIIIDGVDISQIGLKDLRSRLTIIPQDPVLFIGPLRLNLDPFNMHTDEHIWKALEHSHLKEFIASLPTGLHYTITEGGENLSVGQRQLICLARALLRKTKVLILDEATAAIDLETDDLIQATIRKEFADCTVLTIAHRLNTILDSDRVIILDRGVIIEFDTPSTLLGNHNTVFYSMAKDAGLV